MAVTTEGWVVELIERREQLPLLDDFAAEASSGKGRVILITGPVACGKTALLRDFGDRFAQAGGVALSAMCARAERTLACGVVSQLLHGAAWPAESVGEARELLAAAADRAADSVDVSEPDPELLRLFNLLCSHVLGLAAGRPLFIGVDDLQHADDASLVFLQQLIRRLSAASILAVFTDGTDTQQARSPLHAELRGQPRFRRIQVSPLSPCGVADLLTTELGEEAALRHAPQFYAATGGNPLLLQALLHDFQLSPGGGALRSGDEAPEYGLAFVSCLHRGEPVLLDVAGALAVLDEDATAANVARILEIGIESVNRALRVMSGGGLLDTERFRHRSARLAVLAEISPATLASWHLRAADVLYEAGAMASAVAQHIHRSGQSPPGWAADVLVEAAELAAAHDQPQQAVAYFELALRTRPSGHRAAAIHSRLAQTEWQRNPALAARHLSALTSMTRAGRMEHRNAVMLVRQLLWHGRVDQATDLLERLRSSLGSDRQADAVVELRALEQWLAYAHPPLARRANRAASGPDAVATPMIDPWLQDTARLADLLIRGHLGEAVEHAQQVLRDLLVGRRHTGWAEESALAAILVLARADRLDIAADWCARLAAGGDDGPAQTWRAILAAARSEIALGQGDLVGAREHAQTALAQVAAKGWGVAVGLPLANLILANSRLGRFNEAAALLSTPAPEAMFQSVYGLRYLFARGQYHMAIRHHHAALADFLSCGELARNWGLDVAGLLPWRASAAGAWLQLGNRDQAKRLISDQLARPGNNGARCRGLSLRMLAATAPASRRPQLLRESLELFEGCRDHYEQATTLAELSKVHHALGDNRRARMVFRRAVHLTKGCHADPLYRDLLSMTTELGGGLEVERDADRLRALTSSEQRVASLAAIGYTNREIAGKLYVTAGTVEQHLTRIYRKLNIKHRQELPSICSG